MRVIASLLVALFWLASAQAVTLSELVVTVKQNNPEIIAARNKWQAAQAQIPQALSWADPRIGVEYEQIPSGSRDLEQGMKMFTAEQMIMFPGTTWAEWQMLQAEARMRAAQYQAKVWEITAQAAAAYYDLFFTDRALEAMAGITGFLDGIKKSAEAKYVVGDVVQADVLMANIEYLMTGNELITLKQEREVKQTRLQILLNRNDDVTIETTAVINLPGTIESEAVWEDAALKNRPELLAMKAELEAIDAAHLKSKMAYFPDTMLGAKKRVMDGWDAMLSFSVPLYFWKQSSGVSAAGLEREAAAASYQNMKNMTSWMVKESWLQADAARRTMRLYDEKIVPQSAQALKVALAAYQSGKVDFPAVLQIARAYKEAKLKFYESQVNYGKALVELERIVGKELR